MLTGAGETQFILIFDGANSFEMDCAEASKAAFVPAYVICPFSGFVAAIEAIKTIPAPSPSLFRLSAKP